MRTPWAWGDMNDLLIPGLFALVVALVTALITYISTRRNQRDLAELNSKLTRDVTTDIENLKTELSQRGREQDALRDYQYEARKRLYRECGPIVFQLAELSEGAFFRITG